MGGYQPVHQLRRGQLFTAICATLALLLIVAQATHGQIKHYGSYGSICTSHECWWDGLNGWWECHVEGQGAPDTRYEDDYCSPEEGYNYRGGECGTPCNNEGTDYWWCWRPGAVLWWQWDYCGQIME